MSLPHSVYFIRHGQSSANAGGRSVESKEVPLTAKGRHQARLLAENFDLVPELVLVPKLRRAQETAAPYCARHNLTPRLEPLLNEFETLSYELIDGLDGDQRRPLVQAYWQEAVPDGLTGPLAESFLDFAGRVEAFRTRVLPQLPPGAVCFGHGMWFGLLVWQIMGFACDNSLAMKAFRRFQLGFPLPNAMVYELSGPDGLNWNIRFHGEVVRPILALTEAEG